jgi:hypothetical protein
MGLVNTESFMKNPIVEKKGASSRNPNALALH